MRETLAIAKALADENRLRAICALAGRELCVCQIVALLDLAPSTVSKHMSVLYAARLVEARKQGRWNYYRLPGEDAPPAARAALGGALDALSSSPRILEDAKALRQILKCSPEELCKSQNAG